jgi:hypothetical protein
MSFPKDKISTKVTAQLESGIEQLLKLKRKTITDIGFIKERCGELLSLAIEYTDGAKTKRIVVGYNGVYWHGEKGKDNPEDKLKIKIKNIIKTGVCELPPIKMIDDPKCFKFLNTKDKELFSLNVSEIKVLPDKIKKYFSVKGKERVNMAEKERSKFPVMKNPLLSDDEKVGEMIYIELSTWAKELQ